MIHHLEVSTLTAILCALAAALLPRSAAALRHMVLLLGVLRFAAYTPWLNGLGAELDRFVPEHRPATPRLLHATLHLLADQPRLPLPATPPSQTWIQLKQAAWWLWYAAAAFSLGTWLGSLARGVRAVRDATFWERGLFLQVVSRLGMDWRTELRIVTADAVPGAQGWLRPRVLLPDGLTNELAEAELEPVLAHELAHLRRRDPLIAGLVRGIVSIFWFHPLLWWMERRMLADRETACDQMTIASGWPTGDYVAGIAKICRSAAGTIPSYAGVTGANLARRIEHILSFQPRRTWPRAVAAIPIALAIFAALGPVAGGLLRAQQSRYGEANQPLAGNYVVLNNLAFLLAGEGRDLDRALAMAQEAHRLRPRSLEVDDTLGWVYLKLDKTDQAILAFRDPILQAPNNFEFRSHMAQALDGVTDPPAWMRELRGLIFTSGPAADARVRELLETIGK